MFEASEGWPGDVLPQVQSAGRSAQEDLLNVPRSTAGHAGAWLPLRGVPLSTAALSTYNSRATQATHQSVPVSEQLSPRPATQRVDVLPPNPVLTRSQPPIPVSPGKPLIYLSPWSCLVGTRRVCGRTV